MKQRYRNLLLGGLCLALAAALVWAVAGQIARQRYLLRLRSMYERSYYSFVSSMDDLEVNLSKLMVTDAPEQELALLGEVSRLAQTSCRELSALPAGDEAVGELMGFVNRLGDYCDSLRVSVADGQPLSEADQESLFAMLGRQIELSEMMRALDVNRLTDIQAEIPEPDGEENPFYESIRPETELPALIYDGPFSQAAQGPLKGLGKESITQEIALSIAKAFVGENRVLSVSPGQELGGEIPCFGVQVETEDAGSLFLQITKQGGQVLLMMPERSPTQTRLGVEQCRQSAEAFLQERGFGPMEADYWQVYSGIVVFNFCALQDGVRLYPDLVKIQISLQDGQVIGFEAQNYLHNHTRRDLPQAKLTQAQALEKVKGLEILSCRLCVIPVWQQERFCYEVGGQRDGVRYLVYINAETGRVENLLKLLLEEDKEMVV